MKQIRNIAIIAHVDHGKTTLVDLILRHSKFFRDDQVMRDCFLDSNDLERERGITILSKNISVVYKGIKINIIDTPGHADFGGQVERVLNLSDGVLLLVDAFEGPMPQTRFVLEKAFRLNLQPVVIINKVDKPNARPLEVLDEVYELFMDLNASNEQLDFPVLYASGKEGWVSTSPDSHEPTIEPLLETIVEKMPGPELREGPLQLQIASLDYSDYLGRIGIGRVYRGTLLPNQAVMVIRNDGSSFAANLRQVYSFVGLQREEVPEIACGDLCAIVGIEEITIGDTIADVLNPEALSPIELDEPTITMLFRANDSPLFGKEGKYVTTRHIRERLYKETQRDVAYRVETDDGEALKVSGRGVLHLSILIENMRREGYELTVSQPQVITKIVDGEKLEPIEILTIEVPSETAGKVIEVVSARRGEMKSMIPRGNWQRLEFHIPTRGIVGLRSKVLNVTMGEGIMNYRFFEYQPFKGSIAFRTNGVMISMDHGVSQAFAIDALQPRGTFFISPNEETYEGMIVGENSKSGDLVVNMQKTKQLTNVRASGSDRALKIIPARRFSLEEALEYVSDDELVEITPQNIRLRKRYLKEYERKRLRNAQAS